MVLTRVCVPAMAGLLVLALGCSSKPQPEPTESATTRVPAPKPTEDAPQPVAPGPPAAGDPGAAAKRAKPHDPKRVLGPAPEGMIWIKGTVNRSPGLFRPLERATDVCIHERDDIPCAESDNAGFYAITAPKSSPIALLYSAPGLTPTLRAFVTGSSDMDIGNTRAANSAGLERIAEAVGEKEDKSLGGIFFAGRAGTSATLEPASGTRFYLEYGNALATGATGVPMRGSAGFFNVQPGPTRIRFAHADGPCAFRQDNPMSGWPDPKDPGVAIVPVLPGHHVHMTSMFCGKARPPNGAAPKPGKNPVKKPAAATKGKPAAAAKP